MKKYNVYLWSGCGYSLDKLEVHACNEDEALYIAVATIVNEGRNQYFLEVDNSFIGENMNEHEEVEGYMYVDATMEGADRPVYLRTENMKIERA